MRPLFVDSIEITPEMEAIAKDCLVGLCDTGVPHVAVGEWKNPIYTAMKSVQPLTGFVFEASAKHIHPECHLVYGHGSVFPHKDYGFGLSAIALVHAPEESLSLDDKDCALFAGGTSILMGLGDMVILDTDKQHAWMCNGDWVLASIPVKRVRKRRV